MAYGAKSFRRESSPEMRKMAKKPIKKKGGKKRQGLDPMAEC